MAIDRSAILNRGKNIFDGLPQTKIAKICEVTHQTVNRYYKRDILPNYDAMLRIAKYANVSMEWLLTGKAISSTVIREAEVLYEAPAINIITIEQYKKLFHNVVSVEAKADNSGDVIFLIRNRAWSSGKYLA